MTDGRGPDYRRYCGLVDRQAAGGLLTEEEQSFCGQMEASDLACEYERTWLDELGDVDAAPNEASHALVEATMSAIADGGLDDEPLAGDLGLPPPAASRRPWIFGAMAVAGVLAVWVGARQPVAAPHTTAVRAPQPIAPPRVELVYASGDTRVRGPNGAHVSERGGLLQQGQRIVVGQGSACFVLDPDVNVCLSEESEIRLDAVNVAEKRLVLMRGRVTLALRPQPHDSSVTVVAGDVESTAIGTTFSVAMTEAKQIQTTVLEGKVQVSHTGKTKMVSAHERHEVVGRRRSTRALSRSDEAPEWANVQATRLWRDRLSGTLEVRGFPPGATVWLDDRQIGSTPLASLVPAGAHKVSVQHDESLLRQTTVDLQVGGRATLTYDLTHDQGQPQEATQEATAPGETQEVAKAKRPSVRSARPKGRTQQRRGAPVLRASESAPHGLPSAADMLGEARRLMLTSRFAAAAQTYEALRQTHPNTPEAKTVLVPLAELQLDRLGNAGLALSLVHKYLQAGGALAHEARYLRVRALERLGRQVQEREAIEALLGAHPDSFHADLLRQRLARLEQ